MNSKLYFNPLNVACKSVTGGVCQGKEIQFNLYYLKNARPVENRSTNFYTPTEESCTRPSAQAYFLFGKDGKSREYYPMEITDYGWTISLKINEIGLYFYHFYIENSGYVNANAHDFGTYSLHNGTEFLLTVYDKSYKTPEWFKGGVMYQIFPDRFCKVGEPPEMEGRIRRDDWGGIPSYKPNEKGKVLNNDFFGGNLKGIESKLDYLKSLGVTVLYLNPIFEAASNHRYDTSDYMKIDPYLGTEEDFRSLVNAAKERGIRVILDGVFNHTGDNSVYFNKYGKYPSVGAYQSKDSPYYAWYSFQDFPNKYSSWWGIDILPEINENSKEYQKFIFGKGGVLKKWLSFGIGGYRLDVADELPDFFLKKLRKSVKESNKDAIIIGEVWEDASSKVAYSQRREYLHGFELDSVMNYPLKDGIIGYVLSGNPDQLLDSIHVLIDHYPKQTLDCLMNILGTHDTARILTVLAGKSSYSKDEMASGALLIKENEREKAINRLKMAALLQFTLPGVPCIYYGDENGSQGYIDPFCRFCFDWNYLNEELISYYQKLGKIRNQYFSVFKDGDFKEVYVKDGFVLYKRTNGKEDVYVYCNNSSEKFFIEFDGEYYDYIQEKIVSGSLQANGFSYGLLVKKN